MLGLALGPAPTTVPPTAEERAFGEYVLLIHQHFRPRREKLPVVTDDDLAGLEMPVQVTIGGRDRLIDSHGTRRWLQRAAPRVSVTFLPEVGHLLRDQTRPALDFLLAEEGGPPRA